MGEFTKKKKDESARVLKKVEVGRVMSWFEYRDRANEEGGRLPTTEELRAENVDVGYDQWTPCIPKEGDSQTGRNDGKQGEDENCWANIGPRKYQIEYPEWGLNSNSYEWKHLNYFYVSIGSSDDNYTHFEKLKTNGGVYQVWFVEKHDGNKFVQHNHADGSYQAYSLGSKDHMVDQGRWSMENGNYTEHTGFPVTGTLNGDANDFYMDVDCGPHGYHKYIGVYESYEGGMKVNPEFTKKKKDESARVLKKVEVGRVMSWFEYRDRANEEGGRLPTTEELRAENVDVGYDQWTPCIPNKGDSQTGRNDGKQGEDENCWANIGPRKYQIEYPEWGLNSNSYEWKHLNYFYVSIGSSDDNYTHFEKLKTNGGVYQVWFVEKHDGNKFVQHN